MRFPSAETDGDSRLAEPTAIVRRVPSFVSRITSMVLLPVLTTTARCRLSGNQLGAVVTGPSIWSSRSEPEGYGTIMMGPYAVDSQLRAVDALGSGAGTKYVSGGPGRVRTVDLFHAI